MRYDSVVQLPNDGYATMHPISRRRLLTWSWCTLGYVLDAKLPSAAAAGLHVYNRLFVPWDPPTKHTQPTQPSNEALEPEAPAPPRMPAHRSR